MGLENLIKAAYKESVNGNRRGDKLEEIKSIQDYIKSSKRIIVPNWNQEKVNVINKVLSEFNLSEAEHLEFHTNSADLSRMPAITKAQMALDLCDCDLVIARGRLGVPGSGSLMVILDSKGRILTGATSPSHVVHNKDLTEAVRDEITICLERIGFKK
ncbi:MAG: DUF3236 domain-containing protein [Methanobacteriales archaeon HGW-Methanobacteriales-1]|jgi:hypothetical protein|nr:MAG: DUF3236 domain-containing protein [Methanobacteriales archaeon HGW-Methanobacteriales-1]